VEGQSAAQRNDQVIIMMVSDTERSRFLTVIKNLLPNASYLGTLSHKMYRFTASGLRINSSPLHYQTNAFRKTV